MENNQSKILNFLKVKKNLVSVIVLASLILLFGVSVVFSTVLNNQTVDPNNSKADSVCNCQTGFVQEGTNTCVRQTTGNTISICYYTLNSQTETCDQRFVVPNDASTSIANCKAAGNSGCRVEVTCAASVGSTEKLLGKYFEGGICKYGYDIPSTCGKACSPGMVIGAPNYCNCEKPLGNVNGTCKSACPLGLANPISCYCDPEINHWENNTCLAGKIYCDPTIEGNCTRPCDNGEPSTTGQCYCDPKYDSRTGLCYTIPCGENKPYDNCACFGDYEVKGGKCVKKDLTLPDCATNGAPVYDNNGKQICNCKATVENDRCVTPALPDCATNGAPVYDNNGKQICNCKATVENDRCVTTPVSPTCSSNGNTCTIGTQCCSGICNNNGVCADTATTYCSANESTCTVNSQCCSRNCNNGTCSIDSSGNSITTCSSGDKASSGCTCVSPMKWVYSTTFSQPVCQTPAKPACVEGERLTSGCECLSPMKGEYDVFQSTVVCKTPTGGGVTPPSCSGTICPSGTTYAGQCKSSLSLCTSTSGGGTCPSGTTTGVACQNACLEAGCEYKGEVSQAYNGSSGTCCCGSGKTIPATCTKGSSSGSGGVCSSAGGSIEACLRGCNSDDTECKGWCTLGCPATPPGGDPNAMSGTCVKSGIEYPNRIRLVYGDEPTKDRQQDAIRPNIYRCRDFSTNNTLKGVTVNEAKDAGGMYVCDSSGNSCNFKMADGKEEAYWDNLMCLNPPTDNNYPYWAYVVDAGTNTYNYQKLVKLPIGNKEYSATWGGKGKGDNKCETYKEGDQYWVKCLIGKTTGSWGCDGRYTIFLTPTSTPPVVPTPTGPYTVGGKVVGSTSGAGKANATVALKSGSNTWETVTDSNGVYVFENKINAGDTYSVEVTKFEGKNLSDALMTIRAGLNTDSGELQWTWRQTDKKNSTTNDLKFEQQKAGYDDCSSLSKYTGTNPQNIDKRCNFTMTYNYVELAKCSNLKVNNQTGSRTAPVLIGETQNANFTLSFTGGGSRSRVLDFFDNSNTSNQNPSNIPGSSQNLGTSDITKPFSYSQLKTIIGSNLVGQTIQASSTLLNPFMNYDPACTVWFKLEQSSSQSEADLCRASSGTWTEFSNGCADLCGTTPQSNCTQVPKTSCDCGSDKCWNPNTKVCDKNSPTPVPPTVLETPVCKSSDPSGNTEVKLDADGQLTFKATFDNLRNQDSSWVGIYNMDNMFPNSSNPQPAKIPATQIEGYSEMVTSTDVSMPTVFKPLVNSRTVNGTTVTYTYKISFSQLNQIDSKTQKKLTNIRLLDFYGYSPQEGEQGYTAASIDCAQRITLNSNVSVTKVDALCPSESPKGVCGSPVKMICPDGSKPSVDTLTQSGKYVCQSLSGGKDSEQCNYTCTPSAGLPACTRECDERKACASGKTCVEVSDDTCNPASGAKQICQTETGSGFNCSTIRECEGNQFCITKYGAGYTCQDKGKVVGCTENKQVCEKTGSSGTTSQPTKCTRTCEDSTQCAAGQECKEFASECSSPSGNAQRCVSTVAPICTNGQCSKFDLDKSCDITLIGDYTAFRTEYKAVAQDKTKAFEVTNPANFDGNDKLDIYDFILFRAAFYKYITENTCNL